MNILDLKDEIFFRTLKSQVKYLFDMPFSILTFEIIIKITYLVNFLHVYKVLRISKVPIYQVLESLIPPVLYVAYIKMSFTYS